MKHPESLNFLNIIATDGHDGEKDTGWEHVSVHAIDSIYKKKRIPSWMEMSFVKDLFWDTNELVIQFHPPKKDHININEHVLHLWRNKNATIELPPAEFV